jgi:CheY-like chemotaxis protein
LIIANGRYELVILIVDDNAAMLRGVEAVVRKGGYSTLTASDPLEALEMSHEIYEDINLLLTDLSMPGIDGVALAQQVLAEYPHIRVLLMTADRQERCSIPCIRKPFRGDDLLKRISEVFSGPPQLYRDLFPE